MSQRAIEEKAIKRYLDLYYAQKDQRRWIISFDRVRRVLPSNLQMGQMTLHEFNYSAINTLSNEINHLFMLISQLSLWKEVLEPLNKEEQGLISLLHVEPRIHFALLTPYNLKQRIIFSATKSLLVEYASDRSSKVIPLPQDADISFKTLLSWLDKQNSFHQRLISSIKAVDAPSPFRSRDYRRKHVHHIPPYLLLGIQAQIDIEVEPNGYKQSVGYQRALPLDNVIDWCTAEHRLLRVSFSALLRFFRNQMMP